MPAVAPTTIHAVQAAAAIGVLAADTGASTQPLSALDRLLKRLDNPHFPYLLPGWFVVVMVFYTVLAQRALKRVRATTNKKYRVLGLMTARECVLWPVAMFQTHFILIWLTDVDGCWLRLRAHDTIFDRIAARIAVFAVFVTIAPAPLVIALMIREAIPKYAVSNRIMSQYRAAEAAENAALENDAAERAVGDYSDTVDEKAPLVETDAGHDANAIEPRASFS